MECAIYFKVEMSGSLGDVDKAYRELIDAAIDIGNSYETVEVLVYEPEGENADKIAKD